MSEMAERIARHLCGEPPDGTDRRTGDDGMSYPEGVAHWKAWESEALKIIALMRDPTPSMMAAADAITPDGFHWAIKDGDQVGGCRIIYHTMIDEALK